MAKDDLKIIEQPVVDDELIIIPDLNKAYEARKPQPSTTSQPKVDLGLDLEILPIKGAERSLGDDELFRKIDEDVFYRPTDAELDKFLEYKKRNPNSSVDFIKGAWDAGWGVLGELGAGAKAIASEPLKSLDFFTAEGWERKSANISEGFARATWDLGVLGREFNELFGRLRDDELREEMQDMKLRQSNPDWKPKGFMGGESQLTSEQKEKMRTTFATSYIKSRIKDDLEDIADTTNNFQDSDDIIKKQFKRKGLAYIEGADLKRDYTTANYIDNVLSDKTKQNWIKDFPSWIKGRERDRWRKSRYLLKVAERARAGDQTVLGEFFGKEFDEKFRKIVNPQVATLLSYAGGPPEIAAATATKIPRKALTAGTKMEALKSAGNVVFDPLQVAPTVSGRVAEGAGKAAKYTGEKLEKFGEYVTETPARAATVGGLLGAAAARDLSSIPYGAAAGVIEQRVGVIPLAGKALQRTGEAAQAIGEVVGRPGGTEGILKAASRVAPSEETAKKLNQLSVLDPAINLVSDLSKGAGAGAFTGLALTLPSEDAQKIGGGFGGGLAGGFTGAGATRFLSKGALLKAQQLNDWEQFRKRLSPKQIESIKKYAPDIGKMGQVMNQIRMIEGAITPEGRGNVDYDFLSPAEFEKRFGAARGVVVSGNRVKPEIIINTGWQGPNSMFHEAWHAMKKFAGTLEEVKVAGEGKQEVPVLKPYLEKVQTLLFGQELNGKQVVKGLFDKETILGDFAEQYTKEMTPEQIKTWEQQFSQDPVTKEKFTPEQAEQNKLNYLMEELEAESFRYLMSGSDPRGIASGQRGLKQLFIDHMLLSEHSKTLRGMKKALSSVGITFKGSGQPSDIFFQKDKKGRYKGLTNSPELNAALRDYVRAWEGLQYRTRYIDEVDPSGFQIGGKGVAGSKVVEFQLKKAENDFLRNHFRSSDIIKKDEDGEVLKMPDGSIKLLNEGQIRKLQENRANLIKEALENTEDPNGMTPEVHKDGEVSFKGVPTARQLDAIDKIPNNILTPNQKQIIREVSTMMSDDPGAPLQFLYNAAIGKGKRYSSSLSSSHRVAVPLGFHASKAQNFYFTALDLGAYHNKLKAWADDSKKALHKGGHKMELWDKDVKSFEADLFKYLENHKKGIEGETGLDPDPKVAEQKRNVLNDFFNINKGEEGEGNFNPIAAARRATDPKTGKQKKRAYQSLENLIRSYRLDRVLDEEFGKSLSYSLGKRVPMKSQRDFYEKQLENFMTLPKGEEGARFMPPPAPTTPQFKRFFEGSKVVDSKGEPLVVYSGHGNTELYGTKYNKNKGTSGGFYATEDPSVASSYARGKIGDREFYEDGSEYRFLNKSGNYNKKIWQIELTPEQQAKAKKFLKEEAGLDVDKYWEENARYDREANRARLTGGVRRLSNVFKFMESMGDTALRSTNETVKFEDKNPSDPNVRAMQDLENQGTTRFEDLLNEIGLKWNAFDRKQPGVFPLYLSIKNPLDANKPFPEDVLTALKKSASRERPKLEGEYWTKDLSMKEFVNEIEKGSEYWSTQVPTKAKKIFQEFGYDGIKELGNKKGDGERQTNWIAFEPEQIKSTLNRGEFSPENPDIRFMPSPAEGYKINRTDSDIKTFDKSVRSQLPSFIDRNNNPKFTEKVDREGYDRSFHLNLLADRVLNEYFNNEPDLRVHSNVVKAQGGEKAAQEYYSTQAFKDYQGIGYNEAAKNKELMYPEIKSLFADFFTSLPEGMKGLDARTGKEINPVQVSLDFFGKGEVRPIDNILDDISNLVTSLDPRRSRLSRDVLGLADIAREAGADVSQGVIDKLYKKAEGMTKAEANEANAKVMSKFPEFFDKQQSPKGVDVYKKIDPDQDARFMPAPTFFSKAERAVEGAKAGIFNKEGLATVDQAKALLQKNAPQTELEWSGVLDYLDLQKEQGGKVSKDDLLNYIKSNGVEIEEVIRGEGEQEKTVFRADENIGGGPATLPGGENYRELVLKLPEGSLKEGESEYFPTPSGHRFPEDNILAHIRFTERTDADGKKMLFLEEVQSDWNIEGRERGFNKPRSAKATRELGKLEEEKRQLVNKYGSFNHPEIIAIDTKIRDFEFENQPTITGAPDMPYKGSKWEDLTMKRMIRYAADNGYDRLGWITGKDTAERYNLSKKVNDLYFNKNEDNTYDVKVNTVEGEEVDVGTGLTADKLKDFIGKDIANKIVNTELGTLPITELESRTGDRGRPKKTYWNTLSGEDLNIGAQWAKNLYDKSLPSKAKKITKKKGAVGRTRLGEGNIKKDFSNELKEAKEDLFSNQKEIDLNQKNLEFIEKYLADGNPETLTLQGEYSTAEAKLNYAQQNKRTLLRKVTDIEEKIKKLPKKSPEANYVDITPEVKEIAEEGFSYFMPAGRAGSGSAPMQTGSPQPPSAGVFMPKVKLTEEEKEESKRILEKL